MTQSPGPAIRLDPAAVNPYAAPYRVVGRMREGVTAAQAGRDLTESVRAVGRRFPGPHAGSALDLAGFRAHVRWLGDDVVGDARPVVVLLLAGVAMLLLLTCANVASLQLATAIARGGELSVRVALGATRGRLVRGALVEGTVLAAAGAVVGIALAVAGTRLLATLVPVGVALGEGFVGTRSLAATALAVLVVGATVGALPVALGVRGGALALRDHGDAGSARTSGRVRRVLAVA